MKQMQFKKIENVDVNSPAGKAILEVRQKFRGIVGDSGFLLLNLMSIVKLMTLHDKFASLGIFITKENREEKYIEILEKDDEQLLNDLETYIECLDAVEIIQKNIDQYNKIIEMIKNEDPNNQEAISKIIKDYIEI